MNTILHSRLTQFWQQIQTSLFPLLDVIELALTPKLQEVVTVLEMINIERFLGGSQLAVIGRPVKIGLLLNVPSWPKLCSIYPLPKP